MSALTKIAVVLLVISSLLLSAGVVVFVNKVEEHRFAAEKSAGLLTKEQDARKQTADLLSASQAQISAVTQDLNGRVATLVKDKDGLVAQLQAEKNNVTSAQAEKKAADVNSQTIAAALKSAQDQLASAQTQVSELRKIRDGLVDERHALSSQLGDASAKVDALSRQAKILEENGQRSQTLYNDLVARVKGAGLEPTMLTQRIPAVPPLEGVVNNVFNAGGKNWASISIGSKESVAKDMKFNIVSDNEFLGYIIIQSIEPNEAAGVLEGPKVEKVRAGNQVKTQIN